MERDEASKDSTSLLPAAKFNQPLERFGNGEAVLERLVEQRTVREWYTTAEVTKMLGKRPFTIREWCYWVRFAPTNGQRSEKSAINSS